MRKDKKEGLNIGPRVRSKVLGLVAAVALLAESRHPVSPINFPAAEILKDLDEREDNCGYPPLNPLGEYPEPIVYRRVENPHKAAPIFTQSAAGAGGPPPFGPLDLERLAYMPFLDSGALVDEQGVLDDARASPEYTDAREILSGKQFGLNVYGRSPVVLDFGSPSLEEGKTALRFEIGNVKSVLGAFDSRDKLSTAEQLARDGLSKRLHTYELALEDAESGPNYLDGNFVDSSFGDNHVSPNEFLP